MQPYYITNYMKKRAAVNVVDEYEKSHTVDSTTVGGPRVNAEPNYFTVNTAPENMDKRTNENSVDPGNINPGRRVEGQVQECPFKVGDKVKDPNGRNGGWKHGFVDEIRHGFELESEQDDTGKEAWLIGVTWQWPLNEIPKLAPRKHQVDPDERGWYTVRVDGSGTCFLQHENQMQASPSMHNLIELVQGEGAGALDGSSVGRDQNLMWGESYPGQDNTAEGGNADHMGSKEPPKKDADVEPPYSGNIDVNQDANHKYDMTSFAKLGRGEDPYIDGVIYGYDDLLPQHKSDVDVNWAKETAHKGREFLWLRTSMKTTDLLTESAKWYTKNRNKKWMLEDRDRVLRLASFMMDGAVITPLMVSPIGEPKGGCWEGYHRLAAADMLNIKQIPVIMKIDPNDINWQDKVAQQERQPWVAVDLDGTILVETGDVGGRPPLGEPYPGAREALQELVDAGVRVSIWTARQYFEDEDGDDAEWQQEIDEHLKYHQIPYTDIYVGKKPPADVFIDNKAIAFKENWPQVLQEAVQMMQKDAITMEAAVTVEAGWKDWVAALALAVAPMAPATANDITDQYPGATCTTKGPDTTCTLPDGRTLKRNDVQQGDENRVKRLNQEMDDMQNGTGDAGDKALLQSLIKKMKSTKLTPEEQAQGDAAAKRCKMRALVDKTGAVEQEADITMDAVMIGNDDDKKDQYTNGDESREALNMPSTWPGQSIAE